MKARRVADPTLIVKLFVVALVSPVDEADNVYPTPALSMLRFEKVATPAFAETEVNPERAPEPGFEAMAMFTVFVKLVTVFPPASFAITSTAGEIVVAAVVLLG